MRFCTDSGTSAQIPSADLFGRAAAQLVCVDHSNSQYKPRMNLLANSCDSAVKNAKLNAVKRPTMKNIDPTMKNIDNKTKM